MSFEEDEIKSLEREVSTLLDEINALKDEVLYWQNITSKKDAEIMELIMYAS
jgi:predicted  nucleic acid-binding Zn-ribbon protein